MRGDWKLIPIYKYSVGYLVRKHLIIYLPVGRLKGSFYIRIFYEKLVKEGINPHSGYQPKHFQVIGKKRKCQIKK